MSERISDESREGDKRVNRGVLVALGVLVFVIVLVMISALVEPGRLSANEIAEQYVRDNTDALGEEIAAYLVSEYPPIKELAGEFIEDRIEQGGWSPRWRERPVDWGELEGPNGAPWSQSMGIMMRSKCERQSPCQTATNDHQQLG